MKKQKTFIFRCSACGHEEPKWLGRCPECGEWNTLAETAVSGRGGPGRDGRGAAGEPPRSLPLSSVDALEGTRIKSGIPELDRVLGGGIMKRSAILVGGEPGIGKSTLLLQVAAAADTKGRILYVSGEESAGQIKMRSDRLGISGDRIEIACSGKLDDIQAIMEAVKPMLIMVDSAQTLFSAEAGMTAGTVNQMKYCSWELVSWVKEHDASLFLTAHVTKDGLISGPKSLEHMVDTVLYFEGERNMSYRLIRSVKNRFGPANEIGVFEMREKGLFGIPNPSEYMLSGRPRDAAGSVVTSSMEGSRPILTEVQALVCRTSFGMPRRSATGLDYNRVVMLMAVLEKKAGLALGSCDGYVNIAGGIKITEPSADAAVVAAVAGSFKNKASDPYTVVFGEVGLTGEIRAVAQAEKRVAEASKLGFKQCVIPQANLKLINQIKKNTRDESVRIFGVSNLNELLEVVLN
ncbi:MAG: DNA repair protein RadA [Synergistaceae bacterium]|nr:DNA repair protein RadA [Synergistaceae bacterium]